MHSQRRPIRPRKNVPQRDDAVDDRYDNASPSASQPILSSTDAIHEHLLALSPERLCAALGSVSTRQAMLALCGLPNEVGEAALAILPRGDAKAVRRGIASLQALELREIDAAKEAIAKASMQSVSADENAVPLAA